jgi:hypothetical protein
MASRSESASGVALTVPVATLPLNEICGCPCSTGAGPFGTASGGGGACPIAANAARRKTTGVLCGNPFIDCILPVIYSRMNRSPCELQEKPSSAGIIGR